MYISHQSDGHSSYPANILRPPRSHLHSVPRYSEDLVAQIDAPPLLALGIIPFIDDILFDIPQFHRFNSYAPGFRKSRLSNNPDFVWLTFSSQPWKVNRTKLAFVIHYNEARDRPGIVEIFQ